MSLALSQKGAFLRRRGGDDATAVAQAPADEDDLVQVLINQTIDHLGDLGLKGDVTEGKVDPLTEAGQAECGDRMSGLLLANPLDGVLAVSCRVRCPR